MRRLLPKEIETRRVFKQYIAIIFITVLLMHGIQSIRTTKILRDSGYLNLVDVGSYKLNVSIFGDGASSEHRIVGIADLNHGDFSVSASKLAKELSNNQLIVIDRAGYGRSEDTFASLTVQTVVEDYRKALTASGIQAPYVLLAESYGGVYATYWETTYPGEIEAVIFLDGTEMHESESANKQNNKPSYLADMATVAAAKIGWGNIFASNKYHIYPSTYSSKERTMGKSLTTDTLNSIAPMLETNKKWDNIESTYAAIKRNTIPKLYISTNDRHSHRVPKLDENDFGDVVTMKNSEYRKDILTPYLDKMGNCRLIYLSGVDRVYEYKPKEFAQIIKSFLGNLSYYKQAPVN